MGEEKKEEVEEEKEGEEEEEGRRKRRGRRKRKRRGRRKRRSFPLLPVKLLMVSGTCWLPRGPALYRTPLSELCGVQGTPTTQCGALLTADNCWPWDGKGSQEHQVTFPEPPRSLPA